MNEREHVVVLLRADLEDPADEEILNARPQIDARDGALSRLSHGRYEHGDFIAEPRIERVSETRAQDDALRIRLQICERARHHVCGDVRNLRLDAGLDAANRRRTQFLASSDHSLKLQIGSRSHHARLLADSVSEISPIAHQRRFG